LDQVALPNSTLAALYRFAWLLAGDTATAEKALAIALKEVEEHLNGLRSPISRQAWLARRVRQSCLQSAPAASTVDPAPRLLRDESLEELEILEIEAYIVAQRIHCLPEPDRTALALFYLDLLPPPEAAKALDLSLEEYCRTLGRARMKLHESMRALHPAPAS
jgi:DNA-directed RNA polymerase specialized sigma24 family protein